MAKLVLLTPDVDFGKMTAEQMKELLANVIDQMDADDVCEVLAGKGLD